MDLSTEADALEEAMNTTMLPFTHDMDLLDKGTSEIQRLHTISNNIRNSYIWIVFALGFPGNIFSIATVLTMQSMTPATFFISFLALGDVCALAAKLVGHQMNVHQVYFGDIGCKLQFFPVFLSMLTNWVLVMICAERFVAVCLPLKKSLIFTKKRSYICAAVLTLALLVFFGILYGAMRGSDSSGLLCGTYNEYLFFWIYGWYWINVLFVLFIPFGCIVVLTGLIIRGLFHSRSQRRSILLNGREKQDINLRQVMKSERTERTITCMLILAAVVFLVLSLPSCIYILAFKRSADNLTNARWEVFDQIQYLLIDSTHAVNFFLYFFSLKRFRSHFFYVLTCKRRKRSRSDGHGRQADTTVSVRYIFAKSDENVSQL